MKIIMLTFGFIILNLLIIASAKNDQKPTDFYKIKQQIEDDITSGVLKMDTSSYTYELEEYLKNHPGTKYRDSSGNTHTIRKIKENKRINKLQRGKEKYPETWNIESYFNNREEFIEFTHIFPEFSSKLIYPSRFSNFLKYNLYKIIIFCILLWLGNSLFDHIFDLYYDTFNLYNHINYSIAQLNNLLEYITDLFK